MRSLVLSFTILIGATVILGGCTGTDSLSARRVEIAQSPITENPSGKTFPGKFIWHDLLTPDPVLAGKFYEELFGWQIDYEGQYAVVRNDGKLIAGILKVEPEEGSARDALWMPSVSVADVDAAVILVEANGGLVLNGPVDMDKRGRTALISDPERADIVLLEAEGGAPEDTDPAMGDWLWDEIWTNDPRNTEKFYSAVLGYDEIASGDDYDVFINEGEWRAGVRYVRDDFKHRLWVPVVRVADPLVTAGRVKGLGGVVWVAPGEAPGNEDTALIADTTGALLLIQRWPSSTAEEGVDHE